VISRRQGNKPPRHQTISRTNPNVKKVTKIVRNYETDCSEDIRTEHEQRNCKIDFEESFCQNGTEGTCAPPQYIYIYIC
jgi:hypothetical protein